MNKTKNSNSKKIQTFLHRLDALYWSSISKRFVNLNSNTEESQCYFYARYIDKISQNWPSDAEEE